MGSFSEFVRSQTRFGGNGKENLSWIFARFRIAFSFNNLSYSERVRDVLDKLKEAKVEVLKTKDGLRVRNQARRRPIDLTTHPYPGFPTDLQAQATALMSVTDGISIITEKIYPDRFMHISEMGRMGAQIILEGASAIVKGVNQLSAAPVMASDLRASAALVLAGLVAKGETEVARIYHLDRGYEGMEQKLQSLGADIRRKKEK